jgi:hypothetical protein
MAGEPERAGGSADAALPGRPPLCLARNCLTVRQFGPLESIDPNDAMILPHGANPDRMKIFGKDRRCSTWCGFIWAGQSLVASLFSG